MASRTKSQRTKDGGVEELDLAAQLGEAARDNGTNPANSTP